MSEPNIPESGDAPPEPTPLTGPPARVLIVDSSELGGLLQALLARHAIDVQLARNANAALDAILASPPHLAIVELELPDASGVDLVHILHQPPSRVPIILVGNSPKDSLPVNVQRGIEM